MCDDGRRCPRIITERKRAGSLVRARSRGVGTFGERRENKNLNLTARLEAMSVEDSAKTSRNCSARTTVCQTACFAGCIWYSALQRVKAPLERRVGDGQAGT